MHSTSFVPKCRRMYSCARCHQLSSWLRTTLKARRRCFADGYTVGPYPSSTDNAGEGLQRVDIGLRATPCHVNALLALFCSLARIERCFTPGLRVRPHMFLVFLLNSEGDNFCYVTLLPVKYLTNQYLGCRSLELRFALSTFQLATVGDTSSMSPPQYWRNALCCTARTTARGPAFPSTTPFPFWQVASHPRPALLLSHTNTFGTPIL